MRTGGLDEGLVVGTRDRRLVEVQFVAFGVGVVGSGSRDVDGRRCDENRLAGRWNRTGREFDILVQRERNAFFLGGFTLFDGIFWHWT